MEYEEKGFAISEDVAELTVRIDKSLDTLRERATVGGDYRKSTNNIGLNYLGNEKSPKKGGFGFSKKGGKKSLPNKDTKSPIVKGKLNYPGCHLI